jgi:hypothetical protein
MGNKNTSTMVTNQSNVPKKAELFNPWTAMKLYGRFLPKFEAKFYFVHYCKTRTGTLLEDKLLYKNQIKKYRYR